MIQISLSSNQGVPCLAVRGQLDFFTHADLRRRLDELVAEGHPRIHLDLEHTQGLDATGLGTLVSAFGKLRSLRRELKIVATSERVSRVLNLANVRWLLPAVYA